jgi:hypothetical protein
MSEQLPNDGSTGDLNRIVHSGPSLGYIAIETVQGDMVASAIITFDHQEVGALLNSETGSENAEEAYLTDLDDDQKQLLEDMQQWRQDPNIDFA